MSVIDQAFIRAYEVDEPTPVAASASPRAGLTDLPRREPLGESVHRPPVGRRFHGATAATNAGATSSAASTALPNERRPLSEFVSPPRTVDAEFKPALEVDQFRWSAACLALGQRPERLQPAIDALLAARDAGRSLIGVGGSAGGVGCTTVVACLARLLAAAGQTVAIVDGNFRSPALANQLGLAVETGWEDVLSGRQPLAESVVYSINDRMALLPLTRGGEAAASRLAAIEASVTAGVLRYHYDMVLFDLGSLVDPVQGPIARRLATQCRLDGVVLTAGPAATAALSPHRLQQSAPEIAAICLGVVENQSPVA